MREEWVSIEGYDGAYEVSNFGRVRSFKFKQERILNQKPLTGGYLYVWLSKKNKAKAMRVHRLVAQAFVENPNGYEQVNHKDENVLNNRSDNLEWCSVQYNLRYGTRVKRVSEAKHKPVHQIDKKTQTIINTFPSIKEAAEKTGSNQSHIGACCRGVRATHNGFLWKFAEGL